MNFIDIILILPLLYGTWRGFKKGLIIELFTLLALLVGIYCAIHFSNYSANFLRKTFEIDGEYMPVIAFTFTLLLVGAMVYFAGKLIEKAVKAIALGTVNKVLGAAFGVIKVLYILSVLIILLEGYDQEEKVITPDLKSNSLLYNPVKQTALSTMPALKYSDNFIQLMKNKNEENRVQ